MKDKIISLLISVKSDLNALEDHFYIIGAGGLHLLDKPVGDTQDIDIVVSVRDAEVLKKRWKQHRIETPLTKEDELFKSNFSRYDFGVMDIEVMGRLQINKNGVFETLTINEFTAIPLGADFSVKVPTVAEFKRILMLFGREKDLQKLAYL